MEKTERAKAEIRDMTKDLLLGVGMAKLLMDSEGDGYGDMLVDTLIEELQKMKSGKATKPAVVTLMGAEKKRYIGTKLIQAEPAWRITDRTGHRYIQTKDVNACCENGSKIEDGYRVVYEDGYESWSPKEVFDAAYRRTDGMSFGLAIEAAKMGRKIARAGWNGKGMWVVYRTGYPDGIPCNRNTADAVGIPEGSLFKVRPYLQMKCVDDSFQMWLASQSDILADDWYIADEPTRCFKADVAASEHACNCAGVNKEARCHE